MTNYLSSIWQYVRFKIKYPSVPFVQPVKRIGTFFSQDGQDLYVASLLVPLLQELNWSRIVVDIGANHPQQFSNSFFFEKYLGCETIAVDPLNEFENLWNTQRHNAKFFNVALGSKSCEMVLNVPTDYDNMFSSLETGQPKKQVKARQHDQRVVEVTTLTSLLAANGINEVLLMSIDVEGAELEVLKGINFSELTFLCVLIENNSDGYFGDDKIRSYMISNGYVYFARLGWLDDLFVHPSLLKIIRSPKTSIGSNHIGVVT